MRVRRAPVLVLLVVVVFIASSGVRHGGIDGDSNDEEHWRSRSSDNGENRRT
jgi:hypothetical protein